MKKLLLLTLTAVIAACSSPGSKKEAAGNNSISKKASTAVITNKKTSLNDISEEELLTKIKDFDENVFNNVKPLNNNVWFPRGVFENILKLLEAERVASGLKDEEEGMPDGFRIYYIVDNTKKDDLSVALVSTKNNGKFSSTAFKHKDYYEHDQDHPLFKVNGRKGKKNFKADDVGAVLYRSCANCPDLECNAVPQQHRVSRSDAHNMVSSYGAIKANTKSVWFSYEMLKSICSLKFSGIRVYYGNYGPNATGERKDRDTFVLMPTQKKGNVEEDLFDCILLTEFWKNFDKDGGFNNGELCPSNCNEM